jgi:uncharacterized repeat protein (TIGR01451 family)
MNSSLVAWRGRGLLAVSVSVLLLAFGSAARAQDPDLSVMKSTDSTIVAANTDVSYEVFVSNFSDQNATGQTVLTDTVPSDMTFVSAAVPDGWNCTLPSAGSGGTITCFEKES